jgi:hypothetical protein
VNNFQPIYFEQNTIIFTYDQSPPCVVYSQRSLCAQVNLHENRRKIQVTLDVAYIKLQTHLTHYPASLYRGNAAGCILKSISNIFKDIGYLKFISILGKGWQITSVTLGSFSLKSFLFDHSAFNYPTKYTKESDKLRASYNKHTEITRGHP